MNIPKFGALYVNTLVHNNGTNYLGVSATGPDVKKYRAILNPETRSVKLAIKYQPVGDEATVTFLNHSVQRNWFNDSREIELLKQLIAEVPGILPAIRSQLQKGLSRAAVIASRDPLFQVRNAENKDSAN